MKKYFTIKYFVLLLSLLLILFKYDVIYKSIYIGFIDLISPTDFIDNSIILSDFLYDRLYTSIVFLITIFTLPIFFKKNWLNKKLSITNSILIIYIFFGLFASLVINFNPNHQIGIKNNSFLSPMSSVSVQLKENNNSLQKIVYETDDDFKAAYDQESSLNKIAIFGTDNFSRDIFSRSIVGLRYTMFISFLALSLSAIIGCSFGFIAGYKGKVWDNLLNKVADLFLAFPLFFLVLLFISLWGKGFLGIVLVLGFSGWMSLFKIIRGDTASLLEKDFLKTSIKLGHSKFYIFKNEILVILKRIIGVNLVFQLSNIIMAEAALSYLGFGVGDEFPTWGKMIFDGQGDLIQGVSAVFFPALLIIITILTLNSLSRKTI